MFNITERVRRRMLRWLLVGVDPELVRRALKTINGGATKGGTVSIDASNITLPGTVDGVDVSGIPHDAGGVPYALDKRGDTMAGDFTPDSPSTRQIGTISAPFSKVYADELHGTVYYADVVFEEKTCGICGKKFAVGDKLVLRVTEVEEKGVHTVPIHKECAGEGK